MAAVAETSEDLKPFKLAGVCLSSHSSFTSKTLVLIFCHRMAYNFAQDPFLNKCQREKCVWRGATFMGRRAGKMRKVTAQALLSLLVWSE